MSNQGKIVKIHYKGTLDNGEVFDSSYEHGEPIEFTCMAGQVVPGFDNGVVDMELGEKKTIHIEPADAYGEVREDLIMEVPLENIPNADQLPVPGTIYMQTPDGNPIPVQVTKVENGKATFDMNHPLAGKALNFEMELVEVREA
jgi:FKBP-type peptidyl-prolyl cis-trans isomerase 2